ncbi:sugar kinase [Alicyclobacillus acidoterrestris]|nr:sugar kinase [Alicyclobacillus acidoterrestris]
MIGQNLNRTKHINRYLVLKTIYESGPISRLGISKITQLTPATISNLTSEFIAEGVLVETDHVSSQSRAGRREILIDINPHGRSVIGVHIGRKIVSCSLVNLKGAILQREDHVADYHSVEQAIEFIEAFVNRLPLEREQILGIALGVNGWVDFPSGSIKLRPDQRWAGVPLVKLVEEKLGFPVVMDNNVVAMALAEKLAGVGKDLDNMLFLFADVGVGAGLVMNGVPYRFGPVAVGHISIHQESAKCWCGSTGCVELFSGADNVLQKARTLCPELFQDEDMDILDLIAHEHTPGLQGLFQEVGTALGVGLTNALNVLSVPNVVVCGHIFQSEIVWKALNDIVAERAISVPSHVSIKRSAFGVHDIGVLGAGSLGIYYFTLVGGSLGVGNEFPYF